MAINAYLASTRPGSLWPDHSQDVARVHQWTSWALSELEPLLVAIMREGRRPAESVDASRIEAWRTDVARLLDAVLEPHLSRHEYLIPGLEFTLADLNVSSVVSSMLAFNMSLAGHAHVEQWLQACLARPAWQKLQKL
jgi:glutathione S-transferase